MTKDQKIEENRLGKNNVFESLKSKKISFAVIVSLNYFKSKDDSGA